jgi:hypothetical protein
MREIIIPFVSNVVDSEDVPFRVRVIGQQRADGIWEGRVEFTGGDYSRPVCTAVETTCSTRGDLEGWATALQPVYLECALQRALQRRLARTWRQERRDDSRN